jgi:class 3 adenylate cyclase/tetratricopeptide (TPR) repeat protein
MVCASCGHENGDAARFCEGCGRPLARGSGERRKVVTVLFCDVVGSTALGDSTDPEALRALLARYFERMRAIVEHHGGLVEKFIGDAVMAVFGVPAVHEDDALRACRAAVEMREAFAALGINGRIAVNTGEVVTGTEERLATGDAVNVTARLEQAAQPGEILLGQLTLALVRDAVDVEPIEPLTLRGKAEPVSAYRLVQLRAAPERRHATRFVGRQAELAVIRKVWERVQAEQRCELVTIVGDAGIGKSRLAGEVLASTDATVVRGRCLPYGEGITYWPVVEVLKQLRARATDEAAAVAIRSLLGESEAATTADEIAWAFRKTLEQAASQRPLVVVFDDIHWGEETFRDLIEHVALLSSGAPILLLCMARPDLTERRPTWPVTFRLEPLADEDVEKLIPDDIAGGLRERIARAAGGNPLFIEEMLSMGADAQGEVTVPPTLQALLAERLDQLAPAERRVLERAAIEGEIFHRGAVQALAPEETQVSSRLASLVRKRLIRPERPPLAGQDGFRFRHILIRDAAYDALPKTTRAELHGRFASWLEEHGTELVELDEILGYHLEQACSYRAQLGLAPNDQLAAEASRHLTAAGRRALSRNDTTAGLSLLERAAAFGPATGFDLALEIDLIEALLWAGRSSEALQRADSLTERGAALGDRVRELAGRIEAGLIRTYIEPEGATEELAALIEGALPVLQAAGDHLVLHSAYRALGKVANMRGQMDAALDAYERAADHGRQAGLGNLFGWGWRAFFRLWGTTPLSEVLAWLDENESPERPWVQAQRARVLAMLGRVDEARTGLAEIRAALADRGAGTALASITGETSSEVELLAGDPAAAAELAAEGCRLLEQLGDVGFGFLSGPAATLARALYALDRLEEADAWAGRAEELAASDDAIAQMFWRQVRAKVLARRGDHAEAERLAREAVAIGEQTDALNAQGDAIADLAEVLLLAGTPDDAAAALAEAQARYERKGNVVSALRAQARLAELHRAA